MLQGNTPLNNQLGSRPLLKQHHNGNNLLKLNRAIRNRSPRNQPHSPLGTFTLVNQLPKLMLRQPQDKIKLKGIIINKRSLQLNRNTRITLPLHRSSNNLKPRD
jgi:hypothetical protein